MRRKNRGLAAISTRVIDLPAFAAHFDAAAAAHAITRSWNHQIGRVGLDVLSCQSCGWGGEEVCAFGGVGVLVEMKTGVAGLARLANDAVAGRGLNPSQLWVRSVHCATSNAEGRDL